MELNEAARRIVGTHRRLIVFFVLLGILIASLLHAGSQRTYTASTRMVLDTPDPRDRSESTSIADMAAGIATSPTEVQGALDDAHITTRNAVDIARHHVSVTALGSSAVLDLRVSDRNRRVAAAVANTLAARVIRTRQNVSSGQLQQVLVELDGKIGTLNRKIANLDVQLASLGFTDARARDAAQRSRDFLAQARSVLESERVSLLATDAQRPNPSIISQAALPTHPDSSHLLQDLILGALLGMVLGVGAAGLIETIRPTFVGGDVLAREFDTPLLGALRGEPDEGRSNRVVSPVAARLHLAAEAAGARGVVLLGVEQDVELDGLAESLEAVSANGTHAPRNAWNDTRSAAAAEGAPHGASVVNRAGAGLPIRAFDVQSSLVDGLSGAGIVLVSPSSLGKTKLDGVRHLLSVTRSPLLGLITYEGPRGGSRGRQDNGGRPSDRSRISWDPTPQVRTWAKGAGARLKDLQSRVPRS
jgi:capsular polysaccharide biosynthesis protein